MDTICNRHAYHTYDLRLSRACQTVRCAWLVLVWSPVKAKPPGPRAKEVLIMFCGTKGLKVPSYVEFSVDFKNAILTKID